MRTGAHGQRLECRSVEVDIPFFALYGDRWLINLLECYLFIFPRMRWDAVLGDFRLGELVNLKRSGISEPSRANYFNEDKISPLYASWI
jgi:hypothetical protein